MTALIAFKNHLIWKENDILIKILGINCIKLSFSTSLIYHKNTHPFFYIIVGKLPQFKHDPKLPFVCSNTSVILCGIFLELHSQQISFSRDNDAHLIPAVSLLQTRKCNSNYQKPSSPAHISHTITRDGVITPGVTRALLTQPHLLQLHTTRSRALVTHFLPRNNCRPEQWSQH